MEKMRYFVLLPEIMVLTLDQKSPYILDENKCGVPMTHARFVRERVADPTFGELGMAGVLAGVRIINALGTGTPGTLVAILDEDWQILVRATENPKIVVNGMVAPGGYDMIAGPQILPFMNAILDATREPPTTSRPA